MLELSLKMKAIMLTIAALLCSLAGAGVHSLCTSQCPCDCKDCPCNHEKPSSSK